MATRNARRTRNAAGLLVLAGRKAWRCISCTESWRTPPSARSHHLPASVACITAEGRLPRAGGGGRMSGREDEQLWREERRGEEKLGEGAGGGHTPGHHDDVRVVRRRRDGLKVELDEASSQRRVGPRDDAVVRQSQRVPVSLGEGEAGHRSVVVDAEVEPPASAVGKAAYARLVLGSAPRAGGEQVAALELVPPVLVAEHIAERPRAGGRPAARGAGAGQPTSAGQRGLSGYRGERRRARARVVVAPEAHLARHELAQRRRSAARMRAALRGLAQRDELVERHVQPRTRSLLERLHGGAIHVPPTRLPRRLELVER